MRRPYIFSLPVLLIARLIGLSDQEVIGDDLKVGHHYFYRSKFLSTIFPLTLLFDTTLVNLVKVKIPLLLSDKLIICDRYIYDIITDLTISLGKEKIANNYVYKILINQIPSNCITFVLLGDERLLKSRRVDVLMDDKITKKIDLYNLLANEYSMIKIDAALPVIDIQEIISKALKI